MLRSIYRVTSWVSSLGLLLASPLAAQEHPAVERGFAADKVYQLSGLDQVGLLNGALTERIPVGGAYRLGAALRYRLNLTYSSKFWGFEAVGGATRSLPNRLDNAGVGWLLSLGRLIPPGHPSNETVYWQYQSPDGAIHALYDVLHPGDTPESGVFYSNDSTILRMKELPAGERTLEFSDGSIHTFRADGLITRIADVNGNHLDVEYPDGLTWKLTDQHARQHFVRFKPGTSDGQSVVLLSEVELATSGGAKATYTFNHQNVMVHPACSDTFHSPTSTIDVPQLTQIVLPNGSTYELGYLATGGCDEGPLESLTLPTLGRIEYGYDNNRYADVTYSDFDGLGHYRQTTLGGNFPRGNVRTTRTERHSSRRVQSHLHRGALANLHRAPVTRILCGDCAVVLVRRDPEVVAAEATITSSVGCRFASKDLYWD